MLWQISTEVDGQHEDAKEFVPPRSLKRSKGKQICVVVQENEEIGAAFVIVGVWESDGLSGGNDLSDGSRRGTILAGRSARRSRGGTRRVCR